MTMPLLKKQQKSWVWKIPTNKKIISEQIWQWKSMPQINTHMRISDRMHMGIGGIYACNKSKQH